MAGPTMHGPRRETKLDRQCSLSVQRTRAQSPTVAAHGLDTRVLYIYISALLSVYAATSVASATPTPCGSRCCRQNAQVWPQQWVVNNNMIITTSLEWRGADLGLVPHVELLTRLRFLKVRMLARAHWWCARGVAGQTQVTFLPESTCRSKRPTMPRGTRHLT